VSFVGLGIPVAVRPLLYPERGALMTNAVAVITVGLVVFVSVERNAKRTGRLKRSG